jgi:hypothetical protein
MHVTRKPAPVVILLAALLACRRGDGPAGDAAALAAATATASWLTDVTAASGIDFVHRSGAAGDFWLPEIMGAGAGFLDYDGDGRLDVYLVQSGSLRDPSAHGGGNRLFRNEGGGRFRDVTAAAGVGGHGYGMGCAAGDYDNDGDTDLYVTNFGPNILYRNEGDGTFSDVTTAAGVGDPSWSTSAAFVDFDHDGDLDLFVANYVAWQDKPVFTDRKCYGRHGARDYCSPQAYSAPALARLYRNDGGVFADVSAASGIAGRPGTGLGVVCSDLNADGRVDIYVANDQMPSFAWINRGDGTFAESAGALGCAVDDMGRAQAGMGVDAADIDNDGDFDLWKVHLHGEAHILYINRGQYFDERTAAWGLAAPTRQFTGFGTALFDHDLDGLLDIFVANGRVQFVVEPVIASDVYAEPNQLLRQEAAGRFTDISSQAGPALAVVENSRAAAFGDYDDDGDVDILIANRDGPARLLRNDAPRRGGFLTLRLLDEHGRDALGARLRCRVNDTLRTMEVRAAYSYCATNDPRLHLGLGPATEAGDIEVLWVDGTVERFGTVRANQSVTLRKGQGQ